MAKVRPYDFIALAAAWLFQSRVGVAVGADMMQKPEIGDEDSASLRTYLDASGMYDWNSCIRDWYATHSPLSVFVHFL